MQVVVLRSLRSKLAEAQAQIHTTAAALHLRDTQHSHEQHASHVGLNEREHLFQQACRAVTNTCNSCSEVCPSCLCQSHMQLPKPHAAWVAISTCNSCCGIRHHSFVRNYGWRKWRSCSEGPAAYSCMTLMQLSLASCGVCSCCHMACFCVQLGLSLTHRSICNVYGVFCHTMRYAA